MKVLRLGNSEDVNPAVPEADRAATVAAKQLESLIGEPVTTTVKPIWPTVELPGLVDQWLDEFDPDLVFLKVTWYWYGYESVPLRLERKLGRLGKPLSRAGLKAAATPRLAHNRLFRGGRRLAHRIIGGDTEFEPRDIITNMDACIRKILAREHPILVVKGTGDGRKAEGPLADHFDRFTARRTLVEGTIQRRCEELGVHFTGTARPRTAAERDLGRGDGVHKGAFGQRHMGAYEGEAMARAWQALHAAGPAPTQPPLA